MASFQKVGQRKVDRKDHIWFKQDNIFKCCLCGATTGVPPNYPTPPDWVPKTFQLLTAEERLMCPREV